MLHTAVAKGRLEAARLLLDRGADIEAEDSWGYTPLFLAVRATPLETCGAVVSPEMLHALLDRGANIHKRAGENEVNPLLHTLEDYKTVDTLAKHAKIVQRKSEAVWTTNTSHALGFPSKRFRQDNVASSGDAECWAPKFRQGMRSLVRGNFHTYEKM